MRTFLVQAPSYPAVKFTYQYMASASRSSLKGSSSTCVQFMFWENCEAWVCFSPLGHSNWVHFACRRWLGFCLFAVFSFHSKAQPRYMDVIPIRPCVTLLNHCHDMLSRRASIPPLRLGQFPNFRLPSVIWVSHSAHLRDWSLCFFPPKNYLTSIPDQVNPKCRRPLRDQMKLTAARLKIHLPNFCNYGVNNGDQELQVQPHHVSLHLFFFSFRILLDLNGGRC